MAEANHANVHLESALPSISDPQTLTDNIPWPGHGVVDQTQREPRFYDP